MTQRDGLFTENFREQQDFFPAERNIQRQDFSIGKAVRRYFDG